MKKISFLLLFSFVFSIAANANNVQLSNVSIVNNGPGQITVKFDVSWENSWRINVGPANYDGVWVFFKYKNSNGKWEHINLTGNNNVLPSGFSVFQNSGFNKVGAMIFRDASNMGTGNVSITNISLGVNNALPYDIDVRAFAVEMVNVPAPTSRPFFGDGDGTNESINALHYADNTATTNSTLPTTCDANSYDDAKLDADGIYIYSNDTIQTTNPIGSLDPFPTYKAFWSMKYELSQAGYRDFLNTLDSAQQASRTVFAPNSVRGTGAFESLLTSNFIVIDIPATATSAAVYSCNRNKNAVHNEANDGEWAACSYLNWTDLAAFLDWSGLAPMSEIQFERMARGNSSAGANPAILGEFAWGDNTIAEYSYNVINPGAANESVSNASSSLGNAWYSATAASNPSPLRNGIFATATSNRKISGASYYGVMELSGGFYEYCIGIGTVAGRSCRVVPNGDGVLSVFGNAKLAVGATGFWPGMEGNNSTSLVSTCTGGCEVTGAGGMRFRGGSISDPKSVLSISDRSITYTPTARANNRGGRGILYIR